MTTIDHVLNLQSRTPQIAPTDVVQGMKSGATGCILCAVALACVGRAVESTRYGVRPGGGPEKEFTT